QAAARVRVAESLAPDLFGGEQWRQVSLLLLFGAMRDDDGAAHAQADDVDRIRRLGENHLVVEDELLHEAGAAAAVLLRPRDAYVAGLEQLLLPGAPAVDECPLALAGRRFLARLVGVQPGADLVAQLPLRWAELEVHAA